MYATTVCHFVSVLSEGWTATALLSNKPDHSPLDRPLPSIVP